MEWIQVDIFTTTAGIEPVGAALLELNTGGYCVRDAADFERFLAGKDGHWDYIDDELMQLRHTETTLTVYIADNEQGRDTLGNLRDALARLRKLDEKREWGRLEYTLSGIREEDWAFAWKKYYVPVKVGKRLVVCPSWETYDAAPQEVLVHLDPGMAFGTGTHQSTRLCMQLMEERVHSGDRVLDVGCGSGILAICSLLLGAGQALGVDIDEVAVRVAAENAARNGVGDRAHFACGSVDGNAQGCYQIIFANIVADVILSLLPSLQKHLAPGGYLIVSGIIDTRAQEVRGALEAAGLQLAESRIEEGWAAFCCKRTDKTSG